MPKAQAAVIDLFIALFLFMIMLSTTIYTWNLYITRLNEDRENTEIIMKAFQATEALVKNEGIPANWNLTNVNLAGLGIDRILFSDKVDLFFNLSEDKIKDIFKIQLYDFNITLKYINGTKIKEKNNLEGEKYNNVKRYALYKNEPAILEFKIGK